MCFNAFGACYLRLVLAFFKSLKTNAFYTEKFSDICDFDIRDTFVTPR
jgi:hypothetical protein